MTIRRAVFDVHIYGHKEAKMCIVANLSQSQQQSITVCYWDVKQQLHAHGCSCQNAAERAVCVNKGNGLYVVVKEKTSRLC